MHLANANPKSGTKHKLIQCQGHIHQIKIKLKQNNGHTDISFHRRAYHHVPKYAIAWLQIGSEREIIFSMLENSLWASASIQSWWCDVSIFAWTWHIFLSKKWKYFDEEFSFRFQRCRYSLRYFATNEYPHNRLASLTHCHNVYFIRDERNSLAALVKREMLF